uniref:hypothetical protein n=1 Tax=Paraoerskovia marina TaxID=545619 RepID=UPI00138E2CDF
QVIQQSSVETDWQLRVGNQTPLLTGTMPADGDRTYHALKSAVDGVKIHWDGGSKGTFSTNETQPCSYPEPVVAPKLNAGFVCLATQDGPVENVPGGQEFAAGDYVVQVIQDSSVETAWQMRVGNGPALLEGTMPADGDRTYHALTSPAAGVSIFWDGGKKGTFSTNETQPCSYPEVPVVQQCESFETVTFADLTDWDTSESHSGGSSEVTTAGLEVHNPQGGKAVGYNGLSFDLAVAGAPSMEWTGTGTAPGLQMGVDLNGDDKWDGVLVNEAYNYPTRADQWWFTKTTFDAPVESTYFSGSSSGYGTLDEWLALYPDANVRYVGYSLGTGPAGDGVISSMTFNCHTFTFAAPEPVLEPVTPALELTQPVCTAVPGELFGQEFSDGAVSFTKNEGISSIHVFNGTDTSNGKPSSWSELEPGQYFVIATPAAGHTFDGALTDGWKLSSSGKATYTLTVEQPADCWEPLPATPSVDVVQPVCTAVPGELFGQDVTDGSVQVTSLVGIRSVYVFNGTDVSTGKPDDLGALAPGAYNVIATPANGFTFDGALAEGWKLSPSGKATFAFTIDEAADCWEPLEVTPVTPEWDDQCGASMNLSATTTPVEGISYEVTETKNGLKVVATPDEGYILTDKPSDTKNPDSWQWTKGDSFELCDATPAVEVAQAQCEAVPGELFGQSVTAGSVSVPELDGVKSVYVFNGTDVNNGKPGDLGALAAGDYLVIATPEADFSFDGNLGDGWELSPSGKATYAFTIDEAADCWEPIEVTAATPTVVDQCGTEGDEVVLPEVDGVSYEAWVAPSGDWRVKATVQDGYALSNHSANDESVKWFTFERDTRDCVTATPPVVDQQCGLGADGISFPQIDGVSYSADQVDGAWIVTAVVDGAAHILENADVEGGSTVTWPVDLGEAGVECPPAPVVVEPVEPTVEDQCGTDVNITATLPEVEGVTYSTQTTADGVVVTALPNPGFVLAEGEGQAADAWTWTFTDSLEACPAPQEPALTGSVATGECLKDAPWIFYDVTLTDPDGQSTGTAARIVLTDGTETSTVELGELGADGTLSGKVLWPGASVAEDGETPTGWPGWAQTEDGSWVETDGNFAWTRGDITATLEVNPEISVDLSYPPATPDCAAAPPVTETGAETTEPTDPDTTAPSTEGEPEASEASETPDSEVLGTSIPSPEGSDVAAEVTDEGGLAETGADLALLGLVALGLLTVGAGVLAFRRLA